MNAAQPAALHACNVTWGPRHIPIVQNISLQVQPGELLGLIGPNGSGKSSLLRLLAAVVAPKRGEVLLNGRAMHHLPRRQIARQIALVSQLADTLDAIRVLDAVELGRTPWLSALQPWSLSDDAIVQAALAAVGMSEKQACVWSTLSGGERQRVHIARALAQQPGILMLDEPTNHLDIHQQLALMHLIRHLPITKVVAMHDLNQAQACDRLAVMAQGRLVMLDTPDAVLQAPLLRDVFQVQLHTLNDPQDGTRVLRFTPLTAS